MNNSVNRVEWRGMETLRGCKVKQSTRIIVTQYSTIKQNTFKTARAGSNILINYSDQPDSALKYTTVRLVIRNGQTLKIQCFFFFLKLQKQNYSKNLSNESDTKFLRSATLVPKSKMSITKFSLLESATQMFYAH